MYLKCLRFIKEKTNRFCSSSCKMYPNLNLPTKTIEFSQDVRALWKITCKSHSNRLR